MLENLYPDLMVDKIQDINLETLRRNGIQGLILDIDNTLVPNFMKEADENAVQWIERVKKAGIKTCIVSNASQTRVIKFNERLKIYAIHRAGKPGTKSFVKAAKVLDLTADKIAVVGDQVFTDVLGAKRAKMMSILVKPIDKREWFFIRLKRIGEKLILSHHKRKYKGGRI